jgi:hypothetical protein
MRPSDACCCTSAQPARSDHMRPRRRPPQRSIHRGIAHVLKRLPLQECLKRLQLARTAHILFRGAAEHGIEYPQVLRYGVGNWSYRSRCQNQSPSPLPLQLEPLQKLLIVGQGAHIQRSLLRQTELRVRASSEQPHRQQQQPPRSAPHKLQEALPRRVRAQQCAIQIHHQDRAHSTALHHLGDSSAKRASRCSICSSKCCCSGASSAPSSTRSANSHKWWKSCAWKNTRCWA